MALLIPPVQGHNFVLEVRTSKSETWGHCTWLKEEIGKQLVAGDIWLEAHLANKSLIWWACNYRRGTHIVLKLETDRIATICHKSAVQGRSAAHMLVRANNIYGSIFHRPKVKHLSSHQPISLPWFLVLLTSYLVAMLCLVSSPVGTYSDYSRFLVP